MACKFLRNLVKGTIICGGGVRYLKLIKQAVLHNDLNDLYCSPTIVRVIKSRIRWAGHVAFMWRGEAYQEFGGET
jgi:hypothetical protein